MIVGWDFCSKDVFGRVVPYGQKRKAPEPVDQKTQLVEERQIVPPFDVTRESLEKDLYIKMPVRKTMDWAIWISKDKETEILQAFKDHGLSSSDI